MRQLLARNIKVYPGRTLRYLSFHDHCHQYKIMLYPTQHLMRTRHRALAGYCVGCEIARSLTNFVKQRMKYFLLALCESCPSLKIFSCARRFWVWEGKGQTLTVEKLGQTSCPMLYTQPLVRSRKQQQCAPRSIRDFALMKRAEDKDVAKAPPNLPFRLRRTPTS